MLSCDISYSVWALKWVLLGLMAVNMKPSICLCSCLQRCQFWLSFLMSVFVQFWNLLVSVRNVNGYKILLRENWKDYQWYHGRRQWSSSYRQMRRAESCFQTSLSLVLCGVGDGGGPAICRWQNDSSLNGTLMLAREDVINCAESLCDLHIRSRA